MKILFELRFTDYGQSGGIENVAYYYIDVIKNKNIDIILDVRKSSKSIYEQKYRDYPNIKVISDPLEGIYHIVKMRSVFFRRMLSLIDKIFYFAFHIELFRRRKKWANSQIADVVIYPNHLMEVQHDEIPVISFMHAILLDYTDREMEFIESHIKKSKALISLWHYPWQEFLEKYPQRKDSWFWIPTFLKINLDFNKTQKVNGINERFWLYVSFFNERKNHIKLIEAYSLAIREEPNLPCLVFVGKGIKEIYLQVKEKIEELNLQTKIISIYDFLPNEQVAYLYKEAEAIISPTLWEAASGTVVEATIIGKPVLCSDVAPLRDYAEIFNLDVEFFDPINILDMKEKIISFNKNIDFHKENAVKNAEILSKYDDEFVASKFFEVINRVIN